MRCIKRSNIWSDVLICWRLERLMWKALRHFKDRIAIQLDWRSSSSSLKERKVQNIWQVIWCIYVHHLNKGTTQQLACSQFLPWPLWITSTTLWGGNRLFVKVGPTSTTICEKKHQRHSTLRSGCSRQAGVAEEASRVRGKKCFTAKCN